VHGLLVIHQNLISEGVELSQHEAVSAVELVDDVFLEGALAHALAWALLLSAEDKRGGALDSLFVVNVREQIATLVTVSEFVYSHKSLLLTVERWLPTSPVYLLIKLFAQ
jgi:hypothetical protein